MNFSKKHKLTVLMVTVLGAAPVVQADEIIFFRDFETQNDWQRYYDPTPDNSDESATGTRHTAFANSATISGGGGTESGELYRNTQLGGGVTEYIFTDTSTAAVTSTPSNFSVTTRNWDIHNGSQNGRISGYRNNDGLLPDPGPNTNQTAQNLNMSGNMLGHVVSGYSLPDELEDNFYQIGGLALNNAFEDITLSFDFDAYIYGDGDGFGLGVSTDGGLTFALLNPTAGSDMQYQTLASYGGDLRTWVGTPDSGTQTGFGGGGHQAGTALFDLSGFAGQTIALRFAFTTNNMNSGSGDGINIDNIKVTGICDEGTSGPNCEPPPPGTGVPEPASLSLALLGLTVLARRRMRRT